jgi:hypothetical protein
MRALVFLSALCLASTAAFPQALSQVSPPPSAVCSIPLTRFASGDIDPLIVKKAPSANDGMPQLRVPAPPCGEPAAQEPMLAQRRDPLMEAAKALQKYVSSRKSAAIIEKSDPVPYVVVPLPRALGESLKP